MEAGALASYGPDNYGLFRGSGYYIDEMLKGEKPTELPVEQPTKFEFIINRKTAGPFSVTIPQTLLVAADDLDRVILAMRQLTVPN